MFGTDFMIRADYRTFEETPCILNSVGVDIATNILIGLYIITRIKYGKDKSLSPLCPGRLRGEIIQPGTVFV